MKNTLIINLFAGPGAGKSTGASYVFSKLKMAGVDAEYVSEFAKDKVWEENSAVFDNQFYVTGKQSFKISRCFGKVDVIVTDSPIAIGAIYTKPDQNCLRNAILEEFYKYKNNNFNFFIKRVKKYNPNGRNQTEAEAKELDNKIKNLIGWPGVDYIEVSGDETGYNLIVDKILEELKK